VQKYSVFSSHARLSTPLAGAAEMREMKAAAAAAAAAAACCVAAVDSITSPALHSTPRRVTVMQLCHRHRRVSLSHPRRRR